jgi:hypothetical protein
MSGGIDWFRWHHGTVTDQKFPLIAKRSGASVAEVIAVWACLLEAASMNEKMRGCLEAPDFEAMDCALGMPEGRAQAIFSAMQARDIVDQHLHVSAWNKRQPKREREDDSSTDRVRAFRERQRHETPSNASATPETPREEKSREEEKTSPSLRSGEKRGKRAPAVDTVEAETLVEAGFDAKTADDFIAHKQRMKAPLTPTGLGRSPARGRCRRMVGAGRRGQGHGSELEGLLRRLRRARASASAPRRAGVLPRT